VVSNKAKANLIFVKIDESLFEVALKTETRNEPLTISNNEMIYVWLNKKAI
jgi:hypothetical protein